MRNRVCLVALACSAIVLFTSLGGTSYPWDSPLIIGLMLAGLTVLSLFNLHDSNHEIAEVYDAQLAQNADAVELRYCSHVYLRSRVGGRARGRGARRSIAQERRAGRQGP